MTQNELQTDELVNAGVPDDAPDEAPAAQSDQTPEARRDEDATPPAAPSTAEDAELLFASDDRTSFETRWTDVQTRFVDDPREAVASADHLVAEVMQSLARRFAEHKSSLEEQWSGGGEVETEDLRQAIQRYRAFFHRLLAA